jgi:phosphoglycolate phosphatase-like HAD superfamily hydrolase
VALTSLVLFDIDGTLLRCGPQVRPLFVAALERVFGPSPAHGGRFRERLDLELETYDFGGRTDPSIVLDLVGATGLGEEEILEGLPVVRDEYVERLDAGLDRDRMQLLPGVEALLAELAARDDITLGLLTGNWRRGAEVKLSRFGLERYFAFGAFGDDGIQRRELVPVALERAHHATGRRFHPERVLVIGDTVHDVDCARASGIPCLAVATGFTPAEVLHSAGAHWVCDDLVTAREVEWFLPQAAVAMPSLDDKAS